MKRDRCLTTTAGAASDRPKAPRVVGAALLAVALFSACSERGSKAPAPETPANHETPTSATEPPTPHRAPATYALVAAPPTVSIGPGHEQLAVWAYGSSVPAEPLRVGVGQPLKVTLTNRLAQPTTIHWHGVRVPNAMDGVPGVTQAPIPPGGTFTYEFTPRDAGTFWFHPHVRGSEQVERGLHGVLIVEDAQPLPWSQDVAWVLDDWRLSGDGQIDPRFNTRHDLAHDGRWGNVTTVNGRTDTELQVRPGERIRLRLANTANGRVFRLQFGGLKARAFAIDGMPAERAPDATAFELAPGNRMDVDLTIDPADAGKRFAILNTYTRQPYAVATIVVAASAAVAGPDFVVPEVKLPDWNAHVADAPQLTYVLNAERGGKHGISWTLNGAIYGEDARADIPQGEFLKIRYDNQSGRLHPMHMHGVFFRVLARDGKPAVEGYWRDTVLVHPRETVDIGLIPHDVGRWAMHCHILEHAEAGMMTLFGVHPAAAPGGGTAPMEAHP